MIFPRAQVVYERLNTSFAQIGPMLEELKADLFTGYVHLVAREYEGIILLSKGGLVNAIEEVRGQRRSGPSMVGGILAKGRERDGMLSVFRLSAEMAELLLQLFNSELLYKDLSTDLAKLERLVTGLEGQGHSGYIEVRLSKSPDNATIFMREGKVLETTLYCQGHITSGPEVLEELIRLADSEGALFSVYRASMAPRKIETPPPDVLGHPEQLGLWQEVLKTMEAAVDGAAKGGVFLAAFKRACIDLAGTYPFLDPFAAEFEYRDGQIRYEGSAPAAELNQGLSRCLAQCVRALAAQPGTRDVLGRLSPALSQLKRRHEHRLTEVGLVEALPELFRA